MSAEKQSRFGVLRGVRDSSQQPVSPLPEPAPLIDDTKQEPFSCTLSRGMKRRLKKASADEGRKQYLLVEQALAEYLAQHHPEIE